MSGKQKNLTELNDQLSYHMERISRCAVESKRFGLLLLASPPQSRYPYVYPRDAGCAVQLFRRITGSRNQYDAAPRAFQLMESMAHFMKEAASGSGYWGQRYSLDGEDKSIYRQEDNIAHGIAILCNYLLAARRLERDVPDLEEFLNCVDRAAGHALNNLYEMELNLFHSTTSIHESALEEGYTCWVNTSFLYALSLVDEVSQTIDERNIISPSVLQFRRHFLYSVSELFLSGDRYVRHIDSTGHVDLRPDITLLSPFYCRPRALDAIHGHAGPVPLLER